MAGEGQTKQEPVKQQKRNNFSGGDAASTATEQRDMEVERIVPLWRSADRNSHMSSIAATSDANSKAAIIGCEFEGGHHRAQIQRRPSTGANTKAAIIGRKYKGSHHRAQIQRRAQRERRPSLAMSLKAANIGRKSSSGHHWPRI